MSDISTNPARAAFCAATEAIRERVWDGSWRVPYIPVNRDDVLYRAESEWRFWVLSLAEYGPDRDLFIASYIRAYLDADEAYQMVEMNRKR